MQINNSLQKTLLNNLRKNQNNLKGSISRLSTGKRINSASDDSAGLSISQRMKGQLRGSQQAQDNIQDGISLLQTAEGGLNEINSSLQRMRELSVQAASDTLTSEDRTKLQNDFKENKKQINNIAKNTEFNNINILDGSLSGEKIEMEPGTRSTIKSKPLFEDIKIEEGNNDKLEIMIDNELKELKLTPDTYSPERLKNHMNKVIENKNLDIFVEFSENRMRFKHSSIGNKNIEIVDGNLVFDLFVNKHNGITKPFHVKGGKSLSNKIEITENYNDTLTFLVNGENKKLQIDSGSYSKNDIIQEMIKTQKGQNLQKVTR